MAIKRRRIVRRVAPTDPNKAQKVAAAEAVCKEIQVSYEEQHILGDEGYHVTVAPYNHSFVVGIEGAVAGAIEWRKLALNHGHAMHWIGSVRHSSKGDLLFQFAPEMNDHLTTRKAKLVEVAHTELDTAFGPAFGRYVTNMMGATPEELLQHALVAIDGADEKRAGELADEPEPIVDSGDMEGWGSWS